jgi:hypothetical protein
MPVSHHARLTSTAWRGLWLGLAVTASSGVAAQATAAPVPDAETASPEAAPDAPRQGLARFFDPEDGQLDLSYFLENARGFLPIPIVITEPAIGYGGGLAGMFVRPRKEAGSEGWARPNLSAVGGFATENGTKGAFAADASRWLEGRLRTTVGAATGKVNLDFYGLGGDSASLDQKVHYSLDFSGAIAQANWQLAPNSPWAIGLRYVYADVDPKLRGDSALAGLPVEPRVKVSAPTAVLEFDTRDNLFTPTQGVYSETSYLASREALGASKDFERFEQIVMGWLPLANRITLGARANYAWSSEGTPFFLRPYIQLRGVPAMRYQGEKMASVEVEARWPVSGRWSGVVFGGGGSARTEREAFDGSKSVGSGGAGFRYTLARKFGMDVGVDVARSSGTTAVYLVVGNAWFRP